MQVKTRFAPSPTGHLHIGSIRTALYSWLFAKHHNGQFVLRIEDTDLERSQSVSVDSIVTGLTWLGLNWNAGPYFQSKRLNRYKEAINEMLEKKDAYICVCSSEQLEKIRINQIKQGYKPRYPGTCRNLNLKKVVNKNYVIRFKNPLSGTVMFHDQIRGEITFDNTELDDLVIQRSNGMPTYNFCVVIDDLDMEITHVIRGEDHINNTPRQINIIHALGAKKPIYAHLSMILDTTGKKISKRNNSVDIIEYYKNGFLPEALLNYIIRLGWSYGNQEIFSVSEMKKLFNLQSVSKSSSIINMKKLLWINKYYINHLPLHYISNILKEYMIKKNINVNNGPCLKQIIMLFKNRCHTFRDIVESCRYFYQELDSFNSLVEKEYLIVENVHILQKCYNKIKDISIWNQDDISRVINDVSYNIKSKIKTINMLLRVTITGNISSPSINSIIYLIGQKKTLLRIMNAIDYIKKVNL